MEDISSKYVVADAAYDSDAIRGQIETCGATACIRPNPTRRETKSYDRARDKHRNAIERFFGRIKRFRRVATRYEKKAQNFLGFAWIASILIQREFSVHAA